MVNGRALDFLADALQRFKQCRGIGWCQFRAFWRIQPNPQGTQAGPQQTQGRHHQADVGTFEPALRHRTQRPYQDGSRQQETGDDPQVTQCRKYRHVAAVFAAVVGAGVFAQAHQMDEVSSFHGIPFAVGVPWLLLWD